MTEEELSLSYLNYPGRPLVMDAVAAISTGMLEFRDPNIIIRPSEDVARFLGEEEINIAPHNQYSLVEATVFGLNDALVRAEFGNSLREEFDEEFALLTAREDGFKGYGVYVYYPAQRELVQYAPQRWHRLSLVTSTSSLCLDPEMKMTWEEVRQILERLVVSVAGASVGNNIAHAVAMEIRPSVLKVADPNLFKVSNANRVRLSYRDIVWSHGVSEEMLSPLGLKNKAIGTASQLHQIDPFMDVWAYYDGVNADNIRSFIEGNQVEPASDVVIEETDDPDSKVMIRTLARKASKRLVMASDIGSSVQIDIRPFDLDSRAPLAYGITDEELLRRQARAHDQLGDRDAWMSFAEGITGEWYKKSGEFYSLTTGGLQKLFSSVPQRGSTASMAGAITAELIADSVLGHHFPERFIVDKRTLTVKCEGELI